MFLFFVCQGHYGRHNNEWPPKSVHVLKSWTCEYVNLCGIRDFVDVTKLKTLRWGWCWITQGPNLAIWILESREPPPPPPFFFPEVRVRGKCDYGRMDKKIQCCWLWRCLKGIMSQEVWVASRAGRGKEKDSPLEPSESNAVLLITLFLLVGPLLNFWLVEL